MGEETLNGQIKSIEIKSFIQNEIIKINEKNSSSGSLNITKRGANIEIRMNSVGLFNPFIIWTCYNKNFYLCHFSFFQFGEWIDIHVDRRLPANRASDELKLLYSKRSKNDLDWWCPLLEKAYAKENFTKIFLIRIREFFAVYNQLDFPGQLGCSTEYFINFRSLPLTV